MLLFATADLAILVTVIVLLLVFLPTTLLLWRWVAGLPSRAWASLKGAVTTVYGWYLEHNLKREALKQEAIKTALLEEQLRNEQVRTFLNEKKDK